MLEILGKSLLRFDAVALAYCLMDNHYHLVVETRRANLSRVMRHVNGVYAQAFNRRHDVVGHLFQGRFHAIHVDRDGYLLEVCRYTELNPVRAQLVASPVDWRWSSCRAHCGLAEAPPWLDVNALRGHLLGIDALSASDCLRAAAAYAEFVSAAATTTRLWENALRQEIYLGEDDFVARTQAKARADRVCEEEIPEEQRRSPQALASSFDDAQMRVAAIARAYANGMRMRAIADAVGLSVSQVSRLVARGEGPSRCATRRQRLRRPRDTVKSALAQLDAAATTGSREQ